MTFTETTLDIIRFYREAPLSNHSIREIAQQLRKAYPLIHGHATTLLKEGILSDEWVGRSRRCALNLSSPKARALLTFTTEYDATQEALIERLEEVQARNPYLTAFLQPALKTLYVVTQDDRHRQALAKELPYPQIKVLLPQEAQEFLLKERGCLPLINVGVYYSLLATIQRTIKALNEKTKKMGAITRSMQGGGRK